MESLRNHASLVPSGEIATWSTLRAAGMLSMMVAARLRDCVSCEKAGSAEITRKIAICLSRRRDICSSEEVRIAEVQEGGKRGAHSGEIMHSRDAEEKEAPTPAVGAFILRTG